MKNETAGYETYSDKSRYIFASEPLRLMVCLLLALLLHDLPIYFVICVVLGTYVVAPVTFMTTVFVSCRDGMPCPARSSESYTTLYRLTQMSKLSAVEVCLRIGAIFTLELGRAPKDLKGEDGMTIVELNRDCSNPNYSTRNCRCHNACCRGAAHIFTCYTDDVTPEVIDAVETFIQDEYDKMVKQLFSKNNNVSHLLRCPNTTSESGLECECGKFNFIRHGSYTRTLRIAPGCSNELVPAEWLVPVKIKITRVLCKDCGTTHAILPYWIIPYCQYSLDVVLKVINYCYKMGDDFDLENEMGFSSKQAQRWMRTFEEQVSCTMDSSFLSFSRTLTLNGITFRVLEEAVEALLFKLCFFDWVWTSFFVRNNDKGFLQTHSNPRNTKHVAYPRAA